jgi:hypothetical protein
MGIVSYVPGHGAGSELFVFVSVSGYDWPGCEIFLGGVVILNSLRSYSVFLRRPTVRNCIIL